MVHQAKTYIFWGIAALAVVAVIFFATSYRGAFLNIFSRSARVSTSTANPSVVLPGINTSSTIADVKTLALSLNQQGKLFLTWTKLSGGTYEVRIFRSRKNGAEWQLWKTVVVQGTPGARQAITLTKDEAKTLTDYNYFFETRDAGGATLGVSDIVSFDAAHPDGNGTITTADTGESVPPTVVAGLPSVHNPGESVPPASPPAPNPPPSQTPPPAPSPPPSGQNQPSYSPPPSYTIYYYTPQGKMSSTSTFPAPNQNFWVAYQNQAIELGWQNLPASTEKVSVSRSPDANGPWSIFFEQARPITDKPYSVSLVDVGINQPYYYTLQALANDGGILASYGPLYLNAASQ